MDVTIDNENVLAGVPRQRGDDDEATYRAALAELAAVASAHASQREEVRAEVDVERLVEDAEQERIRSVRRGAGVVALVLAIAATIVTMVLVFPRHPHAPSGRPGVSAASLVTARALGNSAHARLAAAGEVVTAASCLSAYAADAAASPLLLPPVTRESIIRDRYVSACLTA